MPPLRVTRGGGSRSIGLLVASMTMAVLFVLVAASTALGAVNDPERTVADWQSGSAPSECSSLSGITGVEYDGAYKFDSWGSAPNGTKDVDAYGNQITISNGTSKKFDWSSNFDISAVIVKAGPGANIYEYDPPARGDTWLYGYQNKDISHVTFCWTYALDASKTAETSYDRDWTWKIAKTGDQSALTLSAGQTFTVNYSVKVDATSADSNFAVKGKIEIKNNTPIDFTIKSVSDVVSPDIAASVSCPVTLPGYTLASGGTLTCTYSASLPDKASRTNTATVTYNKAGGADRTATATANVAFGKPTTETDECVTVTDDKKGTLGTVCAESSPYTTTFTYPLDVGPYAECGVYEFKNTASFTTNDTKTTGSSSWTVTVTVPCDGCTLTQGYWKTHSDYGPAPYDDTWALLLPLGPDEAFFSSGQTYYQVLWTAPQGNAYYILAHQYIAAELNLLNGAGGTSEVTAAMAAAKTLFANNGPDDVKGQLRKTALQLATTLDNYNNGLIGPGHCSE